MVCEPVPGPGGDIPPPDHFGWLGVLSRVRGGPVIYAFSVTWFGVDCVALLKVTGEPWDHLPSALLLSEAGGYASSLTGGPVGQESNAGMIVSNPKIYQTVIDLLSE